MTKGIYDIVSEKNVNDEKTVCGAIDYITDQMKKRDNLTIILTEVPDISAENSDSRQILALVNLANKTGGAVIIMTHNPVWNQLQRAGMTIKMELPNEDEM